MQGATAGYTSTEYVSPNLAYIPVNNALGFTGNLTVNGTAFANNISEVSSTVSIVNNSITLNLAAASIFNVTLNSNITVLQLSNVQASGFSTSFIMVFTGSGASQTVVWPSNFKWPSGTAPTITSTATKKDIFLFFTVDGGISWQAFIAGQNL
jgi:hypothetical protein